MTKSKTSARMPERLILPSRDSSFSLSQKHEISAQDQTQASLFSRVVQAEAVSGDGRRRPQDEIETFLILRPTRTTISVGNDSGTSSLVSAIPSILTAFCLIFLDASLIESASPQRASNLSSRIGQRPSCRRIPFRPLDCTSVRSISTGTSSF